MQFLVSRLIGEILVLFYFIQKPTQAAESSNNIKDRQLNSVPAKPVKHQVLLGRSTA